MFASMKLVFCRTVALLCAILSLMLAWPVTTARAQDDRGVRDQNPFDSISQSSLNMEIEIRSDNDMYLMILQDQYYTNGLFLNVRKKAKQAKLTSKEVNRIYGLSVGHKMYNPFTAQIDSIQDMDRPFAGFVTVRGYIQQHFRKDHMLHYGLDLGIVGEMAAGETLQNHLHTLLNMYHTAGWDYQVKNSIGIDAFVKYSGTLFRAGRWLDGSVQADAILGTNHVRGIVGGTIRLGLLNPFSSSDHFHARLQASDKKALNECYIYWTSDAQAVGYDVTLQGGRFVTDKGPKVVKPHRQMYSNHGGFVLGTNKFSFRAEYSIQSKESPMSIFRHQYGTVAMSLRF